MLAFFVPLRHVSKVVFFLIQLSGDGFLAQTLGTGIIPLVGETYIANTDISFTIGDLESHFRDITIPNKTEQ